MVVMQAPGTLYVSVAIPDQQTGNGLRADDRSAPLAVISMYNCKMLR